MDLRSGESYWISSCSPDATIAGEGPLRADIRCEAVIIGGGVTGALLADMLSSEGVDVAVIDKRRFGAGSTAASTALLMYELDVPLTQLQERYGVERARRCYLASLHALHALQHLARGLNEECGLHARTSIHLASRRRHVDDLERERIARREAGIRTDLFSADDIAARFPFRAPAGLVSHDAAVIDPLRLTSALLRRAARRGGRLYPETCAADIDPDGAGVRIITDRGCSIRARVAIVATGYETGALLDRPPGSLHSSYVVCSQPLAQQPPWHEEWLIWETRRPYLYMRTTDDGRAMVGGGDVGFKNELARDALLGPRTRKLVRRFERMFPGVGFEPAFAWTGTFGESDDGLPYIGAVASRPGCLFAMGYGGNGITFGMLAAEIIRDAVMERANEHSCLFAFDRSP